MVYHYPHSGTREAVNSSKGLLPVFIKFYRNTDMLIHLSIVHGCFWTAIAELNSFDRDHIACKPQNIYYLALSGQSLQNPSLENDFNFHCILCVQDAVHR